MSPYSGVNFGRVLGGAVSGDKIEPCYKKEKGGYLVREAFREGEVFREGESPTLYYF